MLSWNSYGEQGWTIIIQVLLNTFPLKDWNSASIYPLTPMQATEWILLPEMTISLIAEDTGEGFSGAHRVMEQSSEYGSIAFPSYENSTADTIVEDFVRERAMARREEVEIEDRVEAKVMKQEGLWQEETEMGVAGHESNKAVLHATGRPKARPLRAKRS